MSIFLAVVAVVDAVVVVVVVVRLLCSPPPATCGGSTVGIARNERKPWSSKFEIEEIERNRIEQCQSRTNLQSTRHQHQ